MLTEAKALCVRHKRPQAKRRDISKDYDPQVLSVENLNALRCSEEHSALLQLS